MRPADSIVIATAGALVCACSLLVDTSDLQTTGAPSRMTQLDAGPDSSAPGGDSGPSGADASADVDAGSVADRYRAAVIADQPLVYYRLGALVDGKSVVDELGSANALVVDGSGVELESPGAIASDPNAAMRFDGHQSRLIATNPRALDVNGSDLTVECWARWQPPAPATYQHLVASCDGGGDSRKGYLLYLIPSSSEIGWEWDTPTARFGSSIKLDTDIEKFSHYVGVYDGGKIRVYVNGMLLDERGTSGSLAPRESDFAIGSDSYPDSFFGGVIDEVAIYAHALDDAAIRRHYELGVLKE